MIIHYGYEDASGEYFIIVDTAKCNACGRCVEVCPQGVLEMRTIMVDLEEVLVAAVTEEHRRKIKYSCAPCNPDEKPQCVIMCEQGAIFHTWKPKGTRQMSEKRKSKEEELKEKGWIKQTSVGEPRLSEIVELYKSLDYEVRLEPVKLDELDEECRKCYEGEIDKVKTVYTRKKK